MNGCVIINSALQKVAKRQQCEPTCYLLVLLWNTQTQCVSMKLEEQVMWTKIIVSHHVTHIQFQCSSKFYLDHCNCSFSIAMFVTLAVIVLVITVTITLAFLFIWNKRYVNTGCYNTILSLDTQFINHYLIFSYRTKKVLSKEKQQKYNMDDNPVYIACRKASHISSATLPSSYE